MKFFFKKKKVDPIIIINYYYFKLNSLQRLAFIFKYFKIAAGCIEPNLFFANLPALI